MQLDLKLRIKIAFSGLKKSRDLKAWASQLHPKYRLALPLDPPPLPDMGVWNSSTFD